MTLLATRDTAKIIEVPDWVRPVITACAAIGEPTSCTFSSVTVSGTFPDGSRGKRLLRLLAEELAERYNLEVTLDVSDAAFVASFRTAVPTALS